MKDLTTILAEAPNNGPYGKTAYYSAQCVWWTSNPEDLGNTKNRYGDDRPGLPCCPHCGSVLYQGDLENFIKQARKNHGHYGRHGIKAFIKAHHQNSYSCAKSWSTINDLLD